MWRLGPYFFSFLLFFGLPVLSAAFLLRLWLLKKQEYRLWVWFFSFGLIAAAGWCVYVVTAFPVHISEKIWHTDMFACFLFAGGCGYLLRLQAVNSMGREKPFFNRELNAKVFFTLFFFFSVFVFVLVPAVDALWHTLYPPEMLEDVNLEPVIIRGELEQVPKSWISIYIDNFYFYLPKDMFRIYAITLPFIFAGYLLMTWLQRLKEMRMWIWGGGLAAIVLGRVQVHFFYEDYPSYFSLKFCIYGLGLLYGLLSGLLMWRYAMRVYSKEVEEGGALESRKFTPFDNELNVNTFFALFSFFSLFAFVLVPAFKALLLMIYNPKQFWEPYRAVSSQTWFSYFMHKFFFYFPRDLIVTYAIFLPLIILSYILTMRFFMRREERRLAWGGSFAVIAVGALPALYIGDHFDVRYLTMTGLPFFIVMSLSFGVIIGLLLRLWAMYFLYPSLYKPDKGEVLP